MLLVRAVLTALLTMTFASPLPALAAPAEQRDPSAGIVFGAPIRTVVGAAVLATNQTSNVRTFTVKATWKQGEAIAATGRGSVNDLRPGERKAVTLIATAPIPPSSDSVRVEVEQLVVDAPATVGADAASRIAFGQAMKSGMGFQVEVTNNDAALHSLVLSAALLRGDELMGVATGAIDGLSTGQTTTASLVISGQQADYDAVVVSVDSVL